MKKLLLTYCLFFSVKSIAQEVTLNFDGQVSAVTSYSPNNALDVFGGVRYLPSLFVDAPVDSNIGDFAIEYSMNLSASTLMHPFDTFQNNTDFSPYRMWMRYTRKQLELRIGLQKIDFGSANLIRPLQWFNQVDPRDPLQLTNGVFGGLGKYTFKNNANVWTWVLQGNERRGFDVFPSESSIPEFGGRVQFPLKTGDVAFSYHNRSTHNADSNFQYIFDEVDENKFGFDIRLDKVVGLWLEASHSRKSENVGLFTNQSLINVGTDYTFGIGNGINVIAEHLYAYYEMPDNISASSNVTALIAAYPIGFFDKISAVHFYSWTANTSTVFVNYEHAFPKFSGYIMAYYNPSTQAGVIQNDLINNFSGPGIRLMAVYNH